ncbi:hypothetical protein LQF12_12180 [Ruania suaedae]|uniref:hypothetical protein n=1 Tax=Ruania suaedae TaxID=2897774 RepID=UPI001E4D65C3|nr:hypothetical protein [Ruania suaedae]UFU02259.1 hypothetical protein LQF12_12180 [Ruania suaedae]
MTRGIYAPVQPEKDLSAAQITAARYRERVLAIACRRREPIFTGPSALALLELPIIGPWPSDVFVVSATRQGRRRSGVAEIARRFEVTTTMANGCVITSVELTLIQAARRLPLLGSLVAADAACRVPRSGPDGPLTTPGALWTVHDRLMPYQGSARVVAMLERVSTGSESPLETLSGLIIESLGFQAPRQQVRFQLSSHAEAFVDFYWEGVNAAGEADGDLKYRAIGEGPGAAERVIAEKRREDELREQLSALTRWGWSDCWQRVRGSDGRIRGAPRLDRLGAKLLRAGVPQTRLRRRLL